MELFNKTNELLKANQREEKCNLIGTHFLLR
nr:MAG TPA: hypothetical protein [Caudoviricetes sp.]